MGHPSECTTRVIGKTKENKISSTESKGHPLSVRRNDMNTSDLSQESQRRDRTNLPWL